MEHRFVEFIPETLEPNVLYISIPYAIVIHQCACGCGHQVATPLTPADWILTYNGESISLYPSIGNWSFPCKSHYWIRDGAVVWSEKWTPRQIEAARKRDAANRRRFDKHRKEAK